MRSGAENRKKTIIAGSLGAVALICVVSLCINLFGGSSDSTPTPPPVATTAKPAETSTATPVSAANAKAPQQGAAGGAIPGVDAQKIASTSSSLDPTLDQSAMLRTENLVYSGTGRNIFSLVYEPPPAAAPTIKLTGRQVLPPVYVTPPPPPTCPPSCPPINLKFFGTAKRGKDRQAFLLQGDDVYLASIGDIVAHKYKIVAITDGSIQVEDLSNSNTQTLPLQQQ